MLQLEPGCKALIIKGSQSGKIVTCLHYIGRPDPKTIKARANYDCWEIDTPIPWVNKDGHTIQLNIFPTKYLMRIDGDWAEDKAQATEKATT